jgi:hypothetical protein
MAGYVGHFSISGPHDLSLSLSLSMDKMWGNVFWDLFNDVAKMVMIHMKI